MDIDPQNFFQVLREYSKDQIKGPAECQRLVTILNYNLTEEQLNASLIDLYLLSIFNNNTGLLQFVEDIVTNSKFDNTSVQLLEIVYTLINNFSQKVEEFIIDVHDKCLKLLNMRASAKVKAKVVNVMIVSFEKIDKCLENQEHYLFIYKSVFEHISKSSHSDTVRQHEYVLLGLFAKQFRYLLSDPNMLRQLFLGELDKQMRCKVRSQSVLYGVCTGLTYYFESFPLSKDNPADVDIVNSLYKYVKELSTISNDHRFGNRAALVLFTSFMDIFRPFIIKEYKQWHKRLLMDWMAKGVEDKKVGEQTLRTLLLTVANQLVGMSQNDAIPILKHFLAWFKSILRNPNAPYSERKLCVQGLNYFSGALYEHYSQADARDVFLMVMQSFEKLYVLNGANPNSEDSEFLPDYVQCLAGFMRYQNFTHWEVYCLQRVVINMIKTFDKVKPLHHSIVIDAVVTTLYYLKETKHFDSFVENIVYLGVVWSCSHRHISDADLVEDYEKIVTVKNYFPFWRSLLKLVTNRSYDKLAIYLEDRQFIFTKLVNELVKTLMILINKLNVNLKMKEVVETDLETANQVEHLDDFNIFLNVTDFYQEILTIIDPEMFKHCICRITNHLVAKCLKYPLVSGFYKLLSFALKIANNLKLFDQGNLTLNQDVVNCKETFSKFLIFLLHKMKQFKDELLISCLYVLLESPLVIVEPLLPQCSGIFITVFHLGRSYIALANIGLSTLEKWQQHMDDKVAFEEFLLQVIPCLDSYLRSKSLGGFSQTTSVEKKRKTAQMLKKRTILVELEPELVQFQKRVLHFVGSQNSKVCQAFVSPDNNFERKVTSNNLHLKVTLPYNDMALEVYLEPFMVRVVELALYSSDKKTRIMACELFHAFVAVFLGQTKQMTHSGLSDLEDLLRHIAMPLLQLACDIDQTVRDIFRPLFVQMIHWYTSRIQREKPHLAVIIEVLMDGITHHTNSSLRDFSGKCLNEFVKWTIKQSSDTELADSPKNIKVLVKKMRFFSEHPDLMKKLGAALIFNNIYKEIREEQALISIFAMEILHIFVSSLDLLESSNEEVDNVVVQITNAVKHLKRIFIEKRIIFKDSDESRRVPSDIPEGNLNGVSKWLLIKTASRSKYCRTVAMELFINLQPISGSSESLSTFVMNYKPDLITLYLEFLVKTPTLNDLDKKSACSSLIKWLQSLLCLLDGLVFVLRNSLCPFDFQDNNLLSLKYFMDNVQDISIEEGLRLIELVQPVSPYTAEHKEQFQHLKSSCSLTILKLANIVLSDELLCKRSTSFWNPSFWKLTLNSIFNPTSLCFGEQLTTSEYEEVLLVILNTIPRKLKSDNVEHLKNLILDYVNQNFDANIDLRRNVGLKQRSLLKGLLLIQGSNINDLIKVEQFSVGLIDKLMNSFLTSSDNNTVYLWRLSELTSEYCANVLKFALENTKEFDSLLTYLYKNTLVTCQEFADNDKEITFGSYLLLKFSDPIVKFLLNEFYKFLKSSEDVGLVFTMTNCVLKYLENHKEEFKNSFNRVAENILDKWFLFEMYFEDNNIDFGLDFVLQLEKLFGKYISYTKDVQKWLVSLICRDVVLLTQHNGLNFLLNVFNVLAAVVYEDDVDNLSEALDKLKLQVEPLILNNTDLTVLHKLFTALPMIKSQAIFKFLLELYINSAPIDLAEFLPPFITNNSEEKQALILHTVYQIALDESRSFLQKKNLVDNVLPYLFRHCAHSVFENFYEENIKDIINKMTVSPKNYGNGLVYFFLLEVLILRVPIGSEDRAYCSITEASGIPKLLAQLLKIALDAFRDSNSTEDKEQLRIYKCAAYKALTSIICNSKKTEKLYDKLFLREENNEDILWNALIDTSITYKFPVDFDSYPQRRKVLINIRDELREQTIHKQSKSIRYIESQRLFHSSLSEDVTKFDFTNSVVRTHGKIEKDNVQDENAENHLGTRVLQGEVYLESSEINNHELMGTVCGVIKHIFSAGICQLPEDPEEMVEFPNWMRGISALLLNPNTHKNIKMFWVKVIDNMKEIFRNFAQYFLEPLLQFLSDKIAGNDLNYFVSDVTVIVSLWSYEVKPNESQAILASNFLDHVIKVLTNDRNDFFKYNLDLIKPIVENWNKFITVPFNTIDEKLNCDRGNRQIEVGIHVAAIFLANNLLPCETSEIETFWKKLISILDSTVSSIYKICAETLGLMLKCLKFHEMIETSFVLQLRTVIRSYLNEINKYAATMEGVAIYYPDLVDDEDVMKIIYRLHKSDINLKIVFLKIICKRADILGGIGDFKSEDWPKFLENQNPEVQLITLDIILKTVAVLKQEPSFKSIIKSVSKNLSNPNTFCRARMYDIMITVLEGDVLDEDVKSLGKEVLIIGLTDTDIDLREKVRSFWSENPIIPTDISLKFTYLLSNFYVAKTEEHFLGYVSYFLMESMRPDDCAKELFEHPLEDCNFEEYKLHANWRLQHPSVVPMFAETLRSYTENDDGIPALSLGELRATQDNFSFAPTQQSVRERHILQITSLESSLMGAREVNQRSSFLNPNEIQLSEQYRLNKRRFLKDKTKISKGYAHLAVAEKIGKIVKRYDAAKEREKKVTIYRNYRKGDIPDIQITLGSLVKSMQMLVMHDSELAKIFITIVYKTVKDKLKGNACFDKSILQSIEHIFKSSIQYNANVFSTMIDILMKSKADFRVDSSLIAHVSQQSGLVSVGALLIEEYLMDVEDSPSSSKRGNCSDSLEICYWLKLAELYRELHEWDLVRTIFIKKSNCKEDVHIAIKLEGEKRWREAQEKYEHVIKSDLSIERQDFYYESYFKCLAHLGEWEKVPKVVESLVSESEGKTWDGLWNNGWLQQKILPWYINAQVRNVLFSGNKSEQFLIDINKSLSNNEQAEYLKNNFSEELCILWLIHKDNNQAKQYLKSGLQSFLEDWHLINPMFGNLRYNQLLNLRTMIEIDRFLSVEKAIADVSRLEPLQKYWRATQSEFLPSITLSEARLLYRKLFIKLLIDKLKDQIGIVKELRKTEILLDISFMNLAVEENNYYMTRKYYKPYASMKHPSLTLIYGNLANLFANLVKTDPALKLNKYLEGIKLFREVVGSSRNDTSLISLLKIMDVSEKVTIILSENPELYPSHESDLSEIFGNESYSPAEMSYEALKSEAFKTPTTSTSQTVIKERTKALVKLAYFAQYRPERQEDFLLCVLRAMKLGSKEAKQLFPCILLLDSLHTELCNVFKSETVDVPTWMFLGWIPQLLANVDTPKVSAISEIILRIATTYPQAIMYSYRLSKENYRNTQSISTDETEFLIDQLDRLLLNDPLVDKFLAGLSKVSVPSATMEYYKKKMLCAQDIETLLKYRDEVMEFFFEGPPPNSNDSNNMRGNVYKHIQGDKSQFQKLNNMLALHKVREILNTEPKSKSLSNDSTLLKDYCPWLANFSAGRLNLELEIPGQYSGDKLPLVQHHVKISGFCANVSVMSSIRRPIKVTMLGMDSKEYPFLIKFGEDIRQDQRIQQLFTSMNNIFASDHKNHQLLTYQVIPLTTSLGIIQWVDNTESLEDFIKRSIPSTRNDVFTRLGYKLLMFIGISEKTDVFDAYGMVARTKDRNKVIPFYDSLVNLIPLDVLRTSVWSLSLTTESFIAFRDNFIKSYAVICICQWILGIGDRHLQNSKVCTRNGKVLGIDFGHAFGTATQFLRVPELVPIRLTPHIVGLMEPLKEEGTFRHVMIDCLKSLRANSASLLATMNVFVQEPSVDWLDQARRSSSFDETGEYVWYPIQKVDQAKRKLQGASSTAILIEDLNASFYKTQKPEYFNAYVSLVEGVPQFDKRARLREKEYLSIEEQVDSLIDHATDRNLLGRMYVGWTAAV